MIDLGASELKRLAEKFGAIDSSALFWSRLRIWRGYIWTRRLSKRLAETIHSTGSCLWAFRAAISRAARRHDALPTTPDRARTTQVAGASRSWSKSKLLRRLPVFFIIPQHSLSGAPMLASNISSHLIDKPYLWAKGKARDCRNRRIELVRVSGFSGAAVSFLGSRIVPPTFKGQTRLFQPESWRSKPRAC